MPVTASLFAHGPRAMNRGTKRAGQDNEISSDDRNRAQKAQEIYDKRDGPQARKDDSPQRQRPKPKMTGTQNKVESKRYEVQGNGQQNNIYLKIQSWPQDERGYLS